MKIYSFHKALSGPLLSRSSVIDSHLVKDNSHLHLDQYRSFCLCADLSLTTWSDYVDPFQCSDTCQARLSCLPGAEG